MDLKDNSVPPPYEARHLYPEPPVMVAPAPPIITQTVVVQPLMGPRSCITVCKSCNHQIQTTVKYEPTTKTHLMALILCLVGCCLCACVPYCIDSCQAANHYCPKCNAYIGTYNN